MRPAERADVGAIGRIITKFFHNQFFFSVLPTGDCFYFVSDSHDFVSGIGKNDLRLADGPNPYEGRMEVYRDGVWLSVCQENVSVTLGNVVCRELGYPA